MATLNLLKEPYEVSFTGNSMQFIWQVAPYGTKERTSDITLTVRVLIENIFGSGFFSEAYVQKILPADDGTIKLDVASIVSPYLDYYLPRTDLSKPIEATGHRKRYQVITTFDAPGFFPFGNPDLPPISPPAPTIYYAIKGGLAKEAWHYKEFFTKVITEDKKPLLFSAAKELVDPDALKYFFWIYPYDDNAAQTVTYTAYCSDGTTVSLASANTVASGKWAVNCAPAGFVQAGLAALISATKSAVKYSVKVTAGETTIVEEYFFNLDNRNFYDPYFLLYRNSVGGLETVRLLGEVDLAAAYDRQQARRTLPPDWFSEIKDEATEETFTYTADTGFMSKEQLLKLRDLFLSKERYMTSPLSTGEGTGVRLLPVVIASNKTKFFSNKDSLVSTSIEWQNAFVNSFFTPGTVMPQTRACPAVEKFIATQLNSSSLQFLWSLEDPYDAIEVQTIIAGVTTIYTYKGNTGMISQPFDNPAVDENVDITIKARCICNPDAVPAEYGAFTIVVLSIKPNSSPIAVDDYFTVPARFEGVLPYSVLDNDYDPDGDDIEAGIDQGIFGVNSGYQIDKKGFVTIYNTPAENTQLSFTYLIKNTDGPLNVSARVYINFGDGPQVVFVKWVLRNISGSKLQTADGWIDFYSDAACTIPLDITALGLTINAKSVETNFGHVTGTKNYSVLGSGTKMKLYSGIISYTDPASEILVTFTVLTGTGYTPVNP